MNIIYICELLLLSLLVYLHLYYPNDIVFSLYIYIVYVYDSMTWQDDMTDWHDNVGKCWNVSTDCYRGEIYIRIAKAKTIAMIALNERAVGQMDFVLVGGGGLGGGGATLYSYIYNIFMWHKPINKDIVTG